MSTDLSGRTALVTVQDPETTTVTLALADQGANNLTEPSPRKPSSDR